MSEQAKVSGEWHSTRSAYPPVGALVEVPNNGGVQLRYQGNLWWLPDMSMYVYYVPEYWREVTS